MVIIYIFIIIAIILSILYFFKSKKRINILRELQRYLKGKDKKRILAWSIIFFLIVSDFFAIYTMFRNEGQVSDRESVIFGLTFAICLEGFPTLLGASVGAFISKVKAKKDDYLRALIGGIVGVLGTILVIWIVYYLRSILIEGNGGYEAFKAGLSKKNTDGSFTMKYYKESFKFILDSFLCWSPILTSTLALFISWVWLPNDEVESSKNKVSSLYRRLVYQISLYEDALHKFQNARIKLWTLVCSDQKMPIRPDVYRYEIFNRIREKLFHNCLEYLDTEMMTYNFEIEALLQSYITELSKHSSMPDEILNLELKTIIESYDVDKNDNAIWDYIKAKDEIHKRLYISLKRDFDYLERKTDIITVSDYPEDY